LALCRGISEPVSVPNVPSADGGRVTLTLAIAPDGNNISVAPWPFIPDSLNLFVEGKILSGRFKDDIALRQAVGAAPAVTLDINLHRA
jgi:hypothetical protein